MARHLRPFVSRTLIGAASFSCALALFNVSAMSATASQSLFVPKHTGYKMGVCFTKVPGHAAQCHAVRNRNEIYRVEAALDQLAVAPSGAVACPADNGSHASIALFRRQDGVIHVRIEMSGCREASTAHPRAARLTTASFRATIRRLAA